MTPYPDEHDQQLINALASLRSKTEIQNFLRDLLTRSEIKEAANRFQIATLLWTTDQSYLDIAKTCKTSTTTVTRVNNWLFHQDNQGYAAALTRLYGKPASNRSR